MVELVKDWALSPDGKAWHRSFRFRDFNQAFGFMARIAVVAETMDHHPDWRNNWNVVEITLSTHSAGGITQRDADLAQKINEIHALVSKE